MSQQVYGSDDPTADGKSGGKKSLAGRMKEKARLPGIKDKVSNFKSKVHIPGKKQSGGGGGDESPEYSDEQSPRSPAATTNSGTGAQQSPTTGYYNTASSTSSQPRSALTAPQNNSSSGFPSKYNNGGVTDASSQSTSKHNNGSVTDFSPQDTHSTNNYQSRDISGLLNSNNPRFTDSSPQDTRFSNVPGLPNNHNDLNVADASPMDVSSANDYQNSDASGLPDQFNNLNVTDVPSQDRRFGNDQERNNAESGSGSQKNEAEDVAMSNVGGSGTSVDRDGNPSGPGSLNQQQPNQQQSLTSKLAGGRYASVKDSILGSATVAASTLGSKMGYYRDDDEHSPAAGTHDHTANSPPPGNAYGQKVSDGWTGLKSKLGLDKPADPNAPPLTEKAKAFFAPHIDSVKGYTSTASDHASWTKDRVAAQTAPTHHDKALSEQVTQQLSALPVALKERVFGPASPTKNATGELNPTSTSPNAGDSGVMSRVSDVVNSLFSSHPKPDPRDNQHTFPAHSDYVKPAAPATPAPPAY